jgi:hypothetical protein
VQPVGTAGEWQNNELGICKSIGKEITTMRRVIWGLFALAAGTSALMLVTPASAVQLSKNAIQVFPAEGNGVCKDYAANAVILEMGPANPSNTLSGTITGPENPEDPDLTGESADYSYDTLTKTLDITNSTTPFDYVLLKNSRQINVFLYPSGGVIEDFDLVLMDNGTGQPMDIERVVLCYGLEDLIEEPAASFPDCNSTVFDPLGVEAICDAVADGTVITLWDPTLAPDHGGFQQCVCNTGSTAVTVQCEPNSSGDPDNLACFGKDKGGLPEAPVTVELYRDPIYCYTIGGTRTCMCIDDPFTPLVNECAQ